ncbi:sterol desaturase family protein [Halotalea alkalilenta]|uniref:sterol desaturase family protein n=1 Tax=Halotalea alkalilenta TaxID=376489 RepID=UPI000B2904D6|nr:sterol desaturase family protein [Halotalea alkalilenta]
MPILLDAMIPALIIIFTIMAMECIATVVHKYIMHGWGWGWHKSHHEQHDQVFEKNDLFAIAFSALAIILFVIGMYNWVMWWIAIGVTAYGAIYFLMHDVLVHRRWGPVYLPRKGYLKRIYQAHRLHHVKNTRTGCVSFGFIYAKPIDKLLKNLRIERKGQPSPDQDK